jgi:predicted ArsR family transcriptional regulator
MPISRKEFVSGKFQTRNDNFEGHPLTVYLGKNRDKAFTVKELAKISNLTDEGIRGHLRIMKDKGLIQHKQPYFIVKVKVVSKPKTKKKVKRTKKKKKR